MIKSNVEKNKKIIKDFILKYTNVSKYGKPTDIEVLQFADVVINDNPYISDFGIDEKINIEFKEIKDHNIRGQFFNVSKKIVLNKSVFEDPCSYNLRKMIRILFHELQHGVQFKMYSLDEENIYRNKLENSQKLHCGTKFYIPNAIKVYICVFSDYICQVFGDMGQDELLKLEKDIQYMIYRNLYIERDARCCGAKNTKKFFENILKDNDLNGELRAEIKHNLKYAHKEYSEEKLKNKDDDVLLNKCFNISPEELFRNFNVGLPKFINQLKGLDNEGLKEAKSSFWAMMTRLSMANDANRLNEYFMESIKKPVRLKLDDYEVQIARNLLGENQLFTKFFASALYYKLREIPIKDRIEIYDKVLSFATSRNDVGSDVIKSLINVKDMGQLENVKNYVSKYGLNEDFLRG